VDETNPHVALFDEAMIATTLADDCHGKDSAQDRDKSTVPPYSRTRAHQKSHYSFIEFIKYGNLAHYSI
jgi:hypothetical protein